MERHTDMSRERGGVGIRDPEGWSLNPGRGRASSSTLDIRRLADFTVDIPPDAENVPYGVLPIESRPEYGDRGNLGPTNHPGVLKETETPPITTLRWNVHVGNLRIPP